MVSSVTRMQTFLRSAFVHSENLMLRFDKFKLVKHLTHGQRCQKWAIFLTISLSLTVLRTIKKISGVTIA